MKKQLLIIGIVAIFVCVGLSGCEESTDTSHYRPAPKPQGNPDFYMTYPTVKDNCGTTSDDGKVWVNFTVTNRGGDGSKNVWAKVYQGIENFQNCGNGRIFNQSTKQEIYLSSNDYKKVSFVFIGIDCHNGSGCYGALYWIESG